MRKFFTLFLSVLIFSTAFAQKERPTTEIKKTTVKPKLDGVIDEVWYVTDSLLIDRPFLSTNGVPTLGEKGETYWKELWHEDGFYLLVNVTDDEYFPNYVKGSGDAWNYDKIEVYFDVNYLLEDAQGPSTGNSGHHQMAPNLTLAKEGGVLTVESNGREHAFKVDKPNYVAEYFVPWTSLKDKEGITVDKTGEIGFDITVNDSDPAADTRRRAVWSHSGEDTPATEAWSNMDQSGKITFADAQPGVTVESVTLTGGTITGDNDTLKIEAVVLPEDASDKTLKWSIAPAEGSKGRATIDSRGVITPILDGVMVVNASSSDGSFIDAAPVNVTISGQVPTMMELSYLKNGNFDNTTATGSPVNWSTGTVTEGVLTFGPDAVLTNQWDLTLLQQTYVPFAMKDMDYIISFKAWADEPRTLPLVLEDAYNDGNQWDSYAASADTSFSGKTWTVYLTTEPKVYSIVVNFGPMQATTVQNFNFQVGLSAAKIHMDSIYLISVADKALIPTAISQERAMESFKVYPNPAVSKLYVDLKVANSRVAIYNSVGVKMEEVIVNGTRHEFDVSRYTKGLYFVKANNAVVKFVK